MDNDTRTGIKWIVGSVVVAIIVTLIFIGPDRLNRYWRSYKADAYGSDWLVIKETMMGEPIRYWELKEKSIGSESNSDGIFFIDEYGEIIHLSGFYTYIQINSSFEETKARYLKENNNDD